MTKRPNIIKSTERTRYIRCLKDGVCLKAEISACVFMYPSYPFQLTVGLYRRPEETLGTAYAVDRTKTAATYTADTIERLMADIKIMPCPRCSTPAFDPATIDTNRDGLCENCFLADLDAQHAEAIRAEHKAIAARDRRMMETGMTVRVSAWVHPADGGDDYQVDYYFASVPTPIQIAELLRKEGSSCLDDYRITHL